MNYSQVYQVLELNLVLKNTIAERFTQKIRVVGEISNYKYYPNSGHSYFSIKDEQSQINCVFFKNQRLHLNHSNQPLELKNGLSAIITAQVSVYEKTALNQLIVYDIEPTGQGSLQAQFEKIRHKLEKEGLFDAEHKKNLPSLPIQIGIISSLQSDALQDILAILKRRYPIAKISIYPSSTQGEKASQELIKAINLANQHKVCELIILTRGGGSIEDLWAYNDEKLALVIYQSKIPIISAVGHQNNYTISDYVADLRAPTPSAAAEMISKDINELNEKIEFFKGKINSLINQYLQNQMQQLDYLNQQILQKINYLLAIKKVSRLDVKNLMRILLNHLAKNSLSLEKKKQKLLNYNPVNKIENLKQELKYKKQSFNLSRLNHQISNYHQDLIKNRLHISELIRQFIHQKNQLFKDRLASINAISALSKGYAAVYSDKQIIQSALYLKPNQKLNLHFKDGQVEAKVLAKKN